MSAFDEFGPWMLFVAAGLVGGIVLFVRGLQAYRRDRQISSVATSTLDSLAAGEVRVTGLFGRPDVVRRIHDAYLPPAATSC